MIKLFRLICLIVLFPASSAVSASVSYGSVTISEITSVYDGDTFKVNIQSFPPIIGNKIGVRIKDIDTPEIRGKCDKERELALEAKRFTKEVLLSARVVELRNMQRGKYFRVVADVFVDGKSLGDMIIKHGLAVTYSGGTKVHSWC